VPYVTDTARYNRPWGIAVASDGNLYVTEGGGFRLVKLNAAGTQQWTVGQAGVWGSDNAHLGSSRAGPEGNPAVDSAGRIYVPDTGNHRVQIFNSNGTYFTTLGNEDCHPGNGLGNKEFCSPRGVAVDSNGRIYVADSDNHRVQVFDSSHIYTATLGVTGVSGSDDAHFQDPHGVAVDGSGNIFVADTENRRVQKCTLSGVSYTCSTFAGATGECGDDFDHLCGPHAVAVDASGRVYVSDRYNQRIQVFDSSGAYLTTIGGNWGPTTGQMRDPLGVAVDSAGNVYVTDSENHRIQKFAPGVPGWQQVNINGFGDRHNESVLALIQVLGNYLYAGTGNSTTGGELWRTPDGTTWTQVYTDGFGTADNREIWPGTVFAGYLYVGTTNDTSGGQIWRSNDGLTWTMVISAGFADVNNMRVGAMISFGDHLYASTGNGVTGAEVWRTPDGPSWTQVDADGFGDANNREMLSMTVFDGYLYVAAQNGDTGCEIWRTPDGTTWTQANADGFGDAGNQWPWLAEFEGYLYAGMANETTGGQVWRSLDGTTWTQVIDNGFGDPNNSYIGHFIRLAGRFYATTTNWTTGAEVWRTNDGLTWNQVSPDGFGDSNNGDLWGAPGVFGGRLFLGTPNWANGGEVWMLLHQVYLPLVLRNHQ